MNLTPGLITEEEYQGLKAVTAFFGSKTVAPNHNPACQKQHPQVLFAFFQSDFAGGRIPYWHVMNAGPSHHSTLSIQGLRDWGIFPRQAA